MILKPQTLSREAFQPFGDVIEMEGAKSYPINDGMCTRFHDLAATDLLEAGGRPLINLFRSKAWPLPLRVQMLERHPLSSQAFMPLARDPFLVVVAPPGADPRPDIPDCTLPPRADVAIIGSGYTGLCAAIQTARGSRHTVLLDAADDR